MRKKGLLFFALAALCGCAQILGIEDTYVVGEDASPADIPEVYDASLIYDAALTQADAMPDAFVNPPGELVQIHLRNAATNELLRSPVSVLIQGSSREVVVDERGVHRTEFPETYEAIRFGLAESATFPVSLVLQVSGPGFLSTTYPVVIYQRGELSAELRIAAIENLPSGVHVARDVSGVADADGTLMIPVTLETRGSSGELTASVTVPQGIVMLDRDRNPLTGALTVEMSHYESGDLESLAAFPGGMDVSTNEGDGLFSTAGLLSLEITDESGREAAVFEVATIEVTMMVPAGIMNPDENREIMAGDKVGLWSHNALTGTWTQEGDVTLVGESQVPVAQFSINHLSLWNLDFKINKCDVSRPIEVRANETVMLVPPEIAQHFVYRLEYTNLDGTRPSFVRVFRPGDFLDNDPDGPNNVLQFRNAPDEDSGRITMTAYWKIVDSECDIGYREFNRSLGTPLCAPSAETIAVNTNRSAPSLEDCPAP